MPAATSTYTWTEPQRAVIALSRLAWAYLELQRAGQTDRAAQVLAYFQDLFKDRKSAVIASYDPQLQANVQNILSGPVQSTGLLDDPTRKALVASLVTGWAHVEAPEAIQDVTTMPLSNVGQWFGSTLVPQASGFSEIWKLADALKSTAQPDMVAILNREVPPFIAGTPVPGPGPSTPAEPGPTTAGPTMPWNTSEATPGTVQGGSQQPIIVTGTRTQFPTWGLWAMGIGGLVAVGIVAWGVWGKK